MGVFLALIWVGSHDGWYTLAYIARTLIVPVIIWAGWKYYTKIRWAHLGLGALFGVLGIIQWIGTEKLLLWAWPSYPKLGGGDPFNPFKEFANPTAAWAFIAIRWAGAALVVPIMEELFWRDYLHRQLIAPANFKLAEIGEWEAKAFFLVPLFFSLVHPQWFTAIIWGLMVQYLLLKTRSIGACILMHAVTNFLLGAYVLWTGDWSFW